MNLLIINCGFKTRDDYFYYSQPKEDCLDFPLLLSHELESIYSDGAIHNERKREEFKRRFPEEFRLLDSSSLKGYYCRPTHPSKEIPEERNLHTLYIYNDNDFYVGPEENREVHALCAQDQEAKRNKYVVSRVSGKFFRHPYKRIDPIRLGKIIIFDIYGNEPSKAADFFHIPFLDFPSFSGEY